MDIKRLRQEVLEDSYSRTNNNKWVVREIQSDDEILAVLDAISNDIKLWLQEGTYKSLNWIKLAISGADLDKTVKAMFVMVLMDGIPKTIQQIVGVGAATLEDYLQDPFKAAKAAAEILGIMCEHDLVDVTPALDGETEYTMISSQYSLPDEINERIHATKYIPPMIIPPLKVRNNNGGCYLTFNEPVILGDRHNYHEDDIALDVINIQNSIPLELDEMILGMEETSNKPLDTPQKIVNFNRMKDASRAVYNLILDCGNEFYNLHAFDMRGRLYSKGYYVHIQSTEYKRCLINFKYKEIIKGAI